MYRSKLSPPPHTTLETIGIVYGSPLPRGSMGTKAGNPHEYKSPDGLYIICSIDDTANGLILHVSFSRRDRMPDYADIKRVREAFFPDTVDVAMIFPKKGQYVNLAKTALHLWELPIDWSPGKDGMI